MVTETHPDLLTDETKKFIQETEADPAKMEELMKKYVLPGTSKEEFWKYFLGLDVSIYAYEEFPCCYIDKIEKSGSSDAFRVNPLWLRKHFPDSKVTIEENGWMWIDGKLASDFLEDTFEKKPELGAEYRDENSLKKIFEFVVKDMKNGQNPDYLFTFLRDAAKVPEETIHKIMPQYND